jgi:hypothetical protein
MAKSEQGPMLCTLESNNYKSHGDPDDFFAAYVHTYNFVASNGEKFSETSTAGFRDCGGSLTYNIVYSINGFTGSLDDLRAVESDLLKAFSAFHKQEIDGERDFYCF